MKKTLTALLLVVLPFLAVAQSGPTDPAMQKARAELEPVYALGRLFGYLATMEGQQPRLVLSRAQAAKIFDLMENIKAVRRFDAKTAVDMLSEIEDRILTPQQLQFTDQLALGASTTPGQNRPGNSSGTGSGPLASYVAGGPFNPMTEPNNKLGKDFASFSQLLSRKLGRQ
jgi:hypothetical protein